VAAKANLAGIGDGFSGDAHLRQAWGESAKADLAGIGDGFSGDAHGWQAWGESAEADLTGIGNRDPTQGDRLHGGKLLNVHFTHFIVSCV